MDTRITTPLFDVVLPGAWTRTTPEPGLTVFRSPTGTEQLSISSVKVRDSLAEDKQSDMLREFVRVRREVETRLAPASVLSDVVFIDAPRRATFTSEDRERHRRSSTLILVRDTGFVVLYLESLGDDAAFEDLVERLSTACAPPSASTSE